MTQAQITSTTFPFSCHLYFGISAGRRGNRTDWDMKAKREHQERQAQWDRENYISQRQAVYWYDKTYGTNYTMKDGRIPSIEEIERRDYLNIKFAKNLARMTRGQWRRRAI